MKKNGFIKHLDFFIIDLLSLVISIFLASFSRNVFNLEYIRVLIIVELLSYVSVSYFYNPFKNVIRRDKLGFLKYHFGFIACQLALVTVLMFAMKIVDVSRVYVTVEYCYFYVIGTTACLVWKSHLKKTAKRAIEDGSNSILVVTTENNLENTVSTMIGDNYENNRVLGICAIDKDLKGRKFEIFDVVCNKEDLLEYACKSWVDGVYFDMAYTEVPEEILTGLAQAGITVYLRLTKIASLSGQTQTISNVFGQTVMQSSVKERTNNQIFLKKCMDIAGGLVGSLICILLACIIGPIIKICSPGGPVFYKQERIGLNGRRFYMYKFRSMVPDAEKRLQEVLKNNRVESNLMFKMENDPRIIPFIGNFIRKSSLDEFPQFFNVLKGDMSLVGTRPPTVNEWNQYELSHRIRMSTKPGITGMWQVSGRNQITDFNEVVKLDAFYINNWSLGLDIVIIFKTVIQMLHFGKNKEAM